MRREGETQNNLNGHVIWKGSSGETKTLHFSRDMIKKLETVLRIAWTSTYKPLLLKELTAAETTWGLNDFNLPVLASQ